MDGNNGFTIDGLNRDDYLGISVSPLGDLRNDGGSALAIGAGGAPKGNFYGAVYVIFSQPSFPATFDLTTLNGTNGFTIGGLNPGEYLSFSVNSLKDINKDNRDDVIIGAPGGFEDDRDGPDRERHM